MGWTRIAAKIWNSIDLLIFLGIWVIIILLKNRKEVER